MNIHNVQFEISAVTEKQYPKNGLAEIAMVGRSNVGKSSLINKTLNRKNFARVSSKPGKTATINFYNVDNKLRLVDLPGYGYAKVSRQEKQKWGEMIQHYLDIREELKMIFLLVDCRHAPSDDDLLMLEWIRYYQKPFAVIATKADKVKPSQREGAINVICEDLQIEPDELIVFSAETGEGREKILALWEEV
ncbi:MAG: YihA family ribosome biogenesis GTP-binding protein [Clostridia bacterium]|nr:YihA family ribosome biogenesis GTP-binding protein [Clostridia bacterium]